MNGRNVKAEIDNLGKETDWKAITGEVSRTYVFPNKQDVSIYNVVSINVRPSGNHRLVDKSGTKYIVPNGWLCIKITADSWSV